MSTTVPGQGDVAGLYYSTLQHQIELAVPYNYYDEYLSSNKWGILSDTAYYPGEFLANLGLTTGTSYQWSWGPGSHRDTFTIQVGTQPPPVPEPPAVVLLGAGLLCLLGLGLVRTRVMRP